MTGMWSDEGARTKATSPLERENRDLREAEKDWIWRRQSRYVRRRSDTAEMRKSTSVAAEGRRERAYSAAERG